MRRWISTIPIHHILNFGKSKFYFPITAIAFTFILIGDLEKFLCKSVFVRNGKEKFFTAAFQAEKFFIGRTFMQNKHKAVLWRAFTTGKTEVANIFDALIDEWHVF